MNKKLFGTLLLGSLLLGGTFVSCKDYDDDIDNLQSQVDALKSSAALKTDVDGLKSSLEGAISAAQNAATAAKAAADAAEKKASDATSELAKKAAQADLEAAQAKLAAAEDKLAKLEAAIAELNGLEAKLTEATAAEFDKMKKELNAEFDAIKESVSAMIQSLEIIDLEISATNVINNNVKLHWGVATKDIEWAGPKGNISKGDLLVGFIQSTKALTVVPATVDLSEANIELVNSIGEAAPVSITATPASKTDAGVIVGNTRAADVQGKWNLDVAPAGVDATTIANAYASKDGKKNVAYAVAVDGRVVTGYKYEVNVETAACKDKYTAKKVIDNDELEYVDSKKSSLVAGVDNEYKVQTSLIYDAYLTFEGNDAERAEELGIKANGLTISIPEDVTSRNDIYATLYAIDLTGTITKQRTKLSAQSGVEPDQGDFVATATTIKPGLKKSDLEIAIGTIIKGLSDADAKQIKSIQVKNKANTPFVYSDADGKIDMVGLNSYGEQVAEDGTTFDVRTIRTLVVTSSATVNPQAVAGADTLQVDFMGNEETGDIIKTIYVPVNVVKPTAAELAAQIKVASNWDGDKLKLTYDNKYILATQIFEGNAALKDLRISYPAATSGETPVVNYQYNPSSTLPANIGIDKTDAATGMYAAINETPGSAKEWKIKTGTATFKLANVAAWTFTYNFDIEMVDAYAGYELKWYKNTDDGRPVEAKAQIKKSDATVYAHNTTTSQDGIAWKYNNAYKAYNSTNDPLTGLAPAKITLEMDDSENNIGVNGPVHTKVGTKWIAKATTPNEYKFGTGTPAITTLETEATITFKFENDFGVVRSFTMPFDIK